MANYDPQNFESVMLYMRQEFGASVFRDASRIYKTVCELSPKLEPYGNIMRQLIECGASAELETASGDGARQAKAMTKARDVLENELFISAERAEYFLGVLRAIYGVATTPKRSKPKQSAKKKPSAKRIQWGECGGDGYSVRYERYENGLLVFSGSGPIRDFEVRERRDGTWYCNTPWWNQRKAISRVEIPNSVTGIGDFAFEGCENLTSVVIPDSVTYIGVGAFAECAGLTSVVIPDSVTRIGYCGGFTWVRNHVHGTFDYVDYVHETLRSLFTGAFQDCTGLTSVVIPDSMPRTGKCNFSGCTGLTSVVIPHSVTYIETGAFAGCVGLTNVVIPDSVTEIRWDVFAGCVGLTSVVIPDSVTYIEVGAFYGCVGLTSVSVPAKTQISGDAFPDTVRIERRA